MSKKEIKIEDTVKVDWTTEKEYWNEYKLNDGTTLKVKLILKGVRRAKDQHTPDGNPMYMAQSLNAIRVLNVPKKLKKIPDPQFKSAVV